MASALNKRQQARNERALQELIKTVSGNAVCADCSARNPGWASWSVGVFLCMRCAALHRKLGTHISKVKSLSMDKWDNNQVDNMRRIGNVESNKAYNPRNVKPQIPIDVDEADSAMERYIRQKYEQRVFMADSRPGTRSNTGSSSSVEDRPPPLPPKPTKRFGFGLQKSSNMSNSVTPPLSPGIGGFGGQESSPPMLNKPSRVFGSNVNTSGDGLDSKLATLRDMGFQDEKKNATVLKGLNGNLDRAVETLIRLGENGKSRGNTPTPPGKPDLAGLSFDRTNTAPAALSSMNPFDALDAVAPAPAPQQQPQAPLLQTQQLPYGGSATQPNTPLNSYNPFLSQTQGMQYQQQNFASQQQQQNQQPQQHNVAYSHNPFVSQQSVPQQGLEQSFQGLQLSNQQPQQQLFPNRTGGYGQVSAPFAQSNPFTQSFTPPPMPPMPQQYNSFHQPQPQTLPQVQQQYQSPASPTSPGNPFLKSARSQMFTPMNTYNSNPFGQVQSQQQQQQPQQPQPQPQQYQQQQMSQNPWMTQQNYSPSNQASNSFDQQQNGYQQYQQQTNPQQTQGAYQKSSIMALYNYPQLAPQRPDQSQGSPAQAQPQASATMPAALGSQPGKSNPFAAAQGPPAHQQQQQPASAVPAQVQAQVARHASNESVDFAGLMGGRHSPDAFSGLSSSFRR